MATSMLSGNIAQAIRSLLAAGSAVTQSVVNAPQIEFRKGGRIVWPSSHPPADAGPGLHVRGCWVVDLVLGKH